MNPETGGFWIIFGGAFDPIHLGHLKLAADIRSARNAAGTIYLPSFVPPLKVNGCVASFEERVTMLEMAVGDTADSFVSPIESERTKENYTLNTVLALKKRYPACDFSFLVGADNLPLISTWHQPEALLAEVSILVGSRPGATGVTNVGLPMERIEIIETSLLDISSTQIRELVADGKSRQELEKLVPKKVAAYIIEKQLYQ